MNNIFSFFSNFFETLWTWILPSFFKLIVIIFIAFFLKHFINTAAYRFVKRASNTKRAETIRQIITSTGQIVIVAITIMMILHELGFDIRPIIASAGILGVAFSLGAQHLMKDVINGFFILFEDQFSIGDNVKIGDLTGIVEKMNLRTTTLKDVTGNVHIIPNSQINQVTVFHK